MIKDLPKRWFNDMGLDLHHIDLPRIEDNGPFSFNIEDYGPDTVMIHATSNVTGKRSSFQWPKGES